ncbi:3-deoxy-D-manno-octulosonic acid transferase [Maritimibacter sp. 55A14]|uniref:3-deoxy-D-manno-octulosonic acid transferase n=1 Tax=Maritimibacter sp. 55A14 TaxID=2174844 RepID=UPI000D6090DD|nr:3-deoxy-D-manno-octulosonic acid transferase [Maritimibacter sp. 55A14]PWE32641.1 3-deoxy-D-manno-octulosonic acid transferase [Maritimibacter sp. 55A14]
MGYSPALAAYLLFSAHAGGYARRLLDRRLSEGKEDAPRIGERMGAPGADRPEGPLVWFHAASVGETLSLLELIRRMGEARPEAHFLVTTGTVTSATILATRLPPRTLHQYVPLDIRAAVVRFLDHWKPDLAVWTESEFWPRLMHETHRRGVPMVLVNARMSRNSQKRWRWARGLLRSLLGSFDHVLAQDRVTAGYLRRLRVPASRIEVAGTLKEGSAALPCNEAERAALAAQLDRRPVWLAASTHPGEEEIVVTAHSEAARSARRLLLIIAPRHPERGPAIARTLRKAGWEVALRSADEEPEEETQIYIADTLGEMGLWYRLAPVSFVGGSLVEIGGHNPFEPGALGSAILHGPHVANFADVYARLAAAGGALEVQDAEGLGARLVEVLPPDKAAALAHAAWEVCSAGAEVTERTLDVLLARLPKPGAAG